MQMGRQQGMRGNPMQQMQQQQPQQVQQDPQQQQAEAIKMANDMMQQQFQQALDEQAWQLLAESGYPIQEDEGQAAQAQGQMPQMGQQFAQ
jgi:hypothetical protein